MKIREYIENVLKEAGCEKDGIIEFEIGSDDGIEVDDNSLNRIKFKIGPMKDRGKNGKFTR